MATPVFIWAWERPIYLWVTLDSLFRNTPAGAADFILINNGSKHSMVREVIAGFERRGMFKEVLHAPENRPQNFPEAVAERRERLGEFFGFVEGDVEVLPGEPSWILEMLSIMREQPEIAYLGSLIDARDFVDLERAQALAPLGVEENRFKALLKAHSPERAYPQIGSERVIDLQPPGRLCLYRTSILDRVPIQPDAPFTESVRAIGMKVGIATRVRHRHLSLLHVFDEPAYDTAARDAFFARIADTH